jgi:fructose-1,6-bisphosphatase/inositol monophosphatase family enzyme
VAVLSALKMKPFASASLAEAGVFAIRQTLRRIIREFEDDPNTAVRQTIDAETKKRAIDVDLIADREFATQFRHYDGGRYAGVIVTGEERPGETGLDEGRFGTYVLVDALDGSDLAERGLANWCSAAVFFDVAPSSAKIRAAVVGMPPNHVYFATDEDPRVRVYRNLPDLEGRVLASLALEAEEVTGLPPGRALSDASLYFYGQKVARLVEVARRPLLAEGRNIEFENLRIYNLGGIPMLVRMCDHQVKRARGVDAVFELSGQRPYDVVPGLFFALKLGAIVLDLSAPQPSLIDISDLEKALLHPQGVQLRYLAAAHERLANELFPILRTPQR